MQKIGMKYRSDIDGLRAIAVVPVVLFHARVPMFGGGFVGVDLFFVISGYLIASLIASEMAAGHFSFTHFYERRIRRIFPALFAVMGFCAVFGWFIMTPDDYKRLGQSIIATTVFVSNILFWSQSGYFDTPAAEKPLLHTWSLAVEEQFYATFPLYLFLVARFLPRHRLAITGLVTLASFLLNVWAVHPYPGATFYFGPTRAWELLLGAILAMGAVPSAGGRLLRNSAALAGAGLIVIAVFSYSKDTTFPGIAATLPTLGTVLIIWSGTNGVTAVSEILSNRPLVFIGKISYSWYLWHFCLLAFGNYLTVAGLGVVETMTIIFVSLVLSVLSWSYIEQPVRRLRWQTFGRPKLFAAAAAAMVVFVGLGSWIDLDKGIPWRLAPDRMESFVAASEFAEGRDKCRVDDQSLHVKFCKAGTGAGDPRFMLWGDSHAQALRIAVDQAAVSRGENGVFAGRGGCAPLAETERMDAGVCRQVNDRILNFILSTPSLETVILAGRWGLWAEGTRYKHEDRRPSFVRIGSAEDMRSNAPNNRASFLKGMERTLSLLSAAGKKIWLIGPVPEVGYDVPKSIYLDKLGLGGATDIRPTHDEFNQRQQFVVSTFHRLAKKYSVKIIWPHEALCDLAKCDVQRGGRPLYSDDNHLSPSGNRAIASIFRPVFE
jgi:peptidoglycan/LPS O-acetylase OafA/YrhL